MDQTSTTLLKLVNGLPRFERYCRELAHLLAIEGRTLEFRFFCNLLPRLEGTEKPSADRVLRMVAPDRLCRELDDALEYNEILSRCGMAVDPGISPAILRKCVEPLMDTSICTLIFYLWMASVYGIENRVPADLLRKLFELLEDNLVHLDRPPQAPTDA